MVQRLLPAVFPGDVNLGADDGTGDHRDKEHHPDNVGGKPAPIRLRSIRRDVFIGRWSGHGSA